MSVKFENFSHSFSIKGKPVFAPSPLGRRIGEDLLDKVTARYSFEPAYYHFRPGGHIAAIHAHRPNRYFCKIDLERFFYSIARNRVVRVLRVIGVPRAEHYGKWSCVRNPYGDPSYVLPYGFVQSPCLATLVLSHSAVGATIRSLASVATVSVYMDDICLSSNDVDALRRAYLELVASVNAAGFSPNPAKLVPPQDNLEIFNCALQQHKTLVTPGRIAGFVPTSPESASAFERYVSSVALGNLEPC